MTYVTSRELLGWEVTPNVEVPLVSWEVTWDYLPIRGRTDEIYCTGFRFGDDGEGVSAGFTPIELFLHCTEIGLVRPSDFTRLVGLLAQIEGQHEFRRMAAGFVPSDLDYAMGATSLWDNPLPPTPEMTTAVVDKLVRAAAIVGDPDPRTEVQRTIPRVDASIAVRRTGVIESDIKDTSKGRYNAYTEKDFHDVRVYDETLFAGTSNVRPLQEAHHSVSDGRHFSIPAYRSNASYETNEPIHWKQAIEAKAGYTLSRSQPAYRGLADNLSAFATVQDCPWALPLPQVTSLQDQHDRLIKLSLPT